MTLQFLVAVCHIHATHGSGRIFMRYLSCAHLLEGNGANLYEAQLYRVGEFGGSFAVGLGHKTVASWSQFCSRFAVK